MLSHLQSIFAKIANHTRDRYPSNPEAFCSAFRSKSPASFKVPEFYLRLLSPPLDFDLDTFKESWDFGWGQSDNHDFKLIGRLLGKDHSTLRKRNGRLSEQEVHILWMWNLLLLLLYSHTRQCAINENEKNRYQKTG